MRGQLRLPHSGEKSVLACALNPRVPLHSFVPAHATSASSSFRTPQKCAVYLLERVGRKSSSLIVARILAVPSPKGDNKSEAVFGVGQGRTGGGGVTL